MNPARTKSSSVRLHTSSKDISHNIFFLLIDRFFRFFTQLVKPVRYYGTILHTFFSCHL